MHDLKVPLDQWPHVLPPFDHQAQVFKETQHLKYWALFMEMGTGKSKIIIDTMCYQFMAGMIDTAVFIAKKGEYATWFYEQIPTHILPQVDYRIIIQSPQLHDKKDGREKVRWWAAAPRGKVLRILVINVESLQYKGGDLLNLAFADRARVMLTVDESTCVANMGANRSKEVYLAADKAVSKRIMSGTPMDESPLNIFGQARVLGRDVLGYRSFVAFRSEFAIMETVHMGTRKFLQVAGYKNLDRLKTKIQKFGTIILKKDCLDLPEKMPPVTVPVLLTKEQAKLYRDLSETAMMELEGHEFEVTNVLAAMVKLHQIVCGQVKIDDDKYISIPNNRINALIDALGNHRGKAVIWTTYRQTTKDIIEALKKEFGDDSTTMFLGGMDMEERQRGLRRFLDPGDSTCRFNVASLQSGAFGQTWTVANLSCYYNTTPRNELRRQSEDRTHRIGQTQDCYYLDFVTPGTVDEHFLMLQRNKADISNYLMGRTMRQLFSLQTDITL